MSHHALELHIEEFGGGFHVAVDVDFDRAVLVFGDRDGGVAPSTVYSTLDEPEMAMRRP